MSNQIDTQTGRKLLEAAYAASESGTEVFAHVEGLPPLPLRSVEPIGDDDRIGTIRCWSGEGCNPDVWIVPLEAIRAIKISGDWAGS